MLSRADGGVSRAMGLHKARDGGQYVALLAVAHSVLSLGKREREEEHSSLYY